MRTLKEFQFKEKRVLVRCDFNVPLDNQGNILVDEVFTSFPRRSACVGEETIVFSSPFANARVGEDKEENEVLFAFAISRVNDFRIRQTLPTIKHLIGQRAKVILISHLGRPKNKEMKYSLRLVAQKLEKLLNEKVHPVKIHEGGAVKPQFNRVKFANDCVGPKIRQEIEKIKPGEIILLENLRFYKEEQDNEESFVKELAGLADIYINDAFGACHRAHASIVGVIKHLPSGAGLLLEKEIKTLTNLMKKSKRPLVFVIGGAKTETKVELINKVSVIADFVLINGLISKEIKEKGIVLKHPQKIIKPIDEIKGKDIGLQTIKLFRKKISLAKTVFFNGPLGMIEKEEFSKGTRKVLEAIIKSKAFSVVGGGETIEFINKLGLNSKFDHLSTGGGAMIAFLSGEKLPGIVALQESEHRSLELNRKL